MTGWSFLTSHARVLLCIARDPVARPRDIASCPGSTERSACGILTGLAAAGYVIKQKDALLARAGARLQPTRTGPG